MRVACILVFLLIGVCAVLGWIYWIVHQIVERHRNSK